MIDVRKIRLAIIGFGVLLVLLAVGYFATHGRIKVTNPGDRILSLIKINDTEHTEPVEVGNGSFISSGSYVVKNTHEGLDRLVHVSVPRWFGTATVTFTESPTAKISRIAALTYEHLFPADNGSLVSFSDIRSYASGYTTHAASDAFGGKYTDTAFNEGISVPTTTTSRQLLSIDSHTANLQSYSFKTGSFTPVAGVSLELPGRIESEENSTLIPKIQRSSDVNSDRVGIYEKKKGTLTILRGTEKERVLSVKINNSRNIVFDLNGSGWAATETTSELAADASEEDEETPLEYRAIIYPNSGQSLTIPLGKAQTVSDIALSPTGEFMAVLKDGELWVYETSSRQVVMVQPFSITTRVFWNAAKLYALTSDTGISVFDSTTKQLLPVSVSTGSNLSFSNATPFGSKLYVTAYNTKENSKLPDGYVIDLDQKSDGVTEELARKLPLHGNDYDVNYLGTTIYVRINYFSSQGTDLATTNRIRQAATQKLESLIDRNILTKSTIVFLD